MIPLEYKKKLEIMVVKHLQLIQYKILKSKFNCNFLSFGI